MPSQHEHPRLAVLENFKQINKMIRSNFMAGRNRKGLPEEEIERRDKNDEETYRITNVMK